MNAAFHLKRLSPYKVISWFKVQKRLNKFLKLTPENILTMIGHIILVLRC
jgi:hypothetical protein